MARPPARSIGPSVLSGKSALTPTESASAAPVTLRAVPEAAESRQETPEAETTAPKPVKAPASKSVSKTAKAPKNKQSFYQTDSDAEQTRGAFRSTAHQEGYASLSDFIAKAVAEKVEQLQNQYNGGRPFEGFGVHQIPKGRPISS